MRSWIIAAFADLSLTHFASPAAHAAPATRQTALERAVNTNSPFQGVRYVTRCHRAHVWRNTATAAAWWLSGAVIAFGVAESKIHRSRSCRFTCLRARVKTAGPAMSSRSRDSPIPCTIIRGRSPGPKFLVTAGVHGAEYSSQGAFDEPIAKR
ncbi:MAG: hypothetical protein ACHQRJ_12140 [Alphaproteobacteria bacterium]